LLTLGPVITQMFGKNTLRGKTHLSFLMPCSTNPVSLRATLSAMPFLPVDGAGLRISDWRRGGERHAQVGANDVDDGLAVRRFVLREPFKRVQTVTSDRGLVAAELLNRLGIWLGDAPLGRAEFAQDCRGPSVVLAAEGRHPPPGRPRSPHWPGTLMCPSAMGEFHEHIISRPRLHRGQPAWTCRHRSIQARPLMRDVTGAWDTCNGHYGRHRMSGRGPGPSFVDQWCERGGTSVAVASVAHRYRSASPAADGADILDRIRRPLCVHESIGTQSPGGE